MAEKTTNPLTCKQCGYANEGERVYCHNCGTKLDRSLLPELNQPEETLEKKRKRIRKFVTPNRGFFVGAGRAFVYTMLLSVVCAGLILIMLPPDNIPQEKSKDELMDARTISRDIENATEASAPTPLTFKEDEINPYLQYSIKAGSSGYLGDSVKFERVFVNLDEDEIDITAEQTVFGKPIYSCISYRLAIRDNKLVATVKGGHFGRLRIHPNLMASLGAVFQNVWDQNEMKHDKNLLDKCQSIDVHKDHVDVVALPEATP